MSLVPIVMPERTVTPTVAVGWALIWFLLHGSIIGLAVAALLRALRRRSAQLRYLVACGGLLAMALCPLATTLQLLATGKGRAGPVVAERSSGREPARAADHR